MKSRRPAAISPAAKRHERQKAQALAALRAAAAPPPAAGEGSAPSPVNGEGDEQHLITPAPPPVPEPGTWRIAELREGQCRFACTPHNARPEAHRFCGRGTQVGPGNLHGSWCPDHLPMVWSGAKTAGGVSRADAERVGKVA